jgi:hypothetical protein
MFPSQLVGLWCFYSEEEKTCLSVKDKKVRFPSQLVGLWCFYRYDEQNIKFRWEGFPSQLVGLWCFYDVVEYGRRRACLVSIPTRGIVVFLHL